MCVYTCVSSGFYFVTPFPILQLNVDLQTSGNITSGLAGALDLGSFRYTPSRGMLADVTWGFLGLRASFRSCCSGLFGDVTGMPAGRRLFGRGQSLK